jgi:hypothetical protein
MVRQRHLVRVLAATALFALLLAAPHSAEAGEITLFYSSNNPRETWRAGQGGTLSLGLVKIAQLEFEAARGLDKLDQEDPRRTTYFTGGAALKLPFTRVSPFAGLGVGVYHQSLGVGWKISTLEAAFVGVKVRIADLIVLRGEGRRIRMHGIRTPYREIESRLSIGAGIAF